MITEKIDEYLNEANDKKVDEVKTGQKRKINMIDDIIKQLNNVKKKIKSGKEAEAFDLIYNMDNEIKHLKSMIDFL